MSQKSAFSAENDKENDPLWATTSPDFRLRGSFESFKDLLNV